MPAILQNFSTLAGVAGPEKFVMWMRDHSPNCYITIKFFEPRHHSVTYSIPRAQAIALFEGRSPVIGPFKAASGDSYQTFYLPRQAMPLPFITGATPYPYPFSPGLDRVFPIQETHRVEWLTPAVVNNIETHRVVGYDLPVYQVYRVHIPTLHEWEIAFDCAGNDPAGIRDRLDLLKLVCGTQITGNILGATITLPGVSRFVDEAISAASLQERIRRLSNALQTYYLDRALYALNVYRAINDEDTVRAVYTDMQSYERIQTLAHHASAPYVVTVSYGDQGFQQHNATLSASVTRMVAGLLASKNVLFENALRSVAARLAALEDASRTYVATPDETDPGENPAYIVDPATGTATNISRASSPTLASLPRTVNLTYLSPEAWARIPEMEARYTETAGETPPPPLEQRKSNFLLFAAAGIAAAFAVKQYA